MGVFNPDRAAALDVQISCLLVEQWTLILEAHVHHLLQETKEIKSDCLRFSIKLLSRAADSYSGAPNLQDNRSPQHQLLTLILQRK